MAFTIDDIRGVILDQTGKLVGSWGISGYNVRKDDNLLHPKWPIPNNLTGEDRKQEHKRLCINLLREVNLPFYLWHSSL